MNTRSKSYNNHFQNWQIVVKDKQDQRNTNIFNYQSAVNHLKKNYLNPRSGSHLLVSTESIIFMIGPS